MGFNDQILKQNEQNPQKLIFIILLTPNRILTLGTFLKNNQ